MSVEDWQQPKGGFSQPASASPTDLASLSPNATQYPVLVK